MCVAGTKASRLWSSHRAPKAPLHLNDASHPHAQVLVGTALLLGVGAVPFFAKRCKPLSGGAGWLCPPRVCPTHHTTPRHVCVCHSVPPRPPSPHPHRQGRPRPLFVRETGGDRAPAGGAEEAAAGKNEVRKEGRIGGWACVYFLRGGGSTTGGRKGPKKKEDQQVKQKWMASIVVFFVSFVPVSFRRRCVVERHRPPPLLSQSTPPKSHHLFPLPFLSSSSIRPPNR